MTGATDTRRWSWWAGAGTCPETYTLNERTREAIIAAGRADFDGEAFTIVCATQDGPFEAAPFDSERLIDDLIDRFAEDNADRSGRRSA
ncbi:MAG: hypothetical protein FJ335_08145, partial [Sphingomonadales bacterium]|nr:hypothetical protein [Sphingomonadales bacterium]